MLILVLFSVTGVIAQNSIDFRDGGQANGLGSQVFSNFVDLPNQRLRNQVSPGPQSSPFSDCALELDDFHGCITYSSVNRAFQTARRFVEETRLSGLKFPPTGNFSNKEAGLMGLAIQETSGILAKEYDLKPPQVLLGLSQIDTTKTEIAKFCPVYLQKRKCEIERYRHIEGTCNNLDNPLWGAAHMAHSRFIPPDYADGFQAPRISASGQPLPSARLISSKVHRDTNVHDHSITTLLIAWGQFVDHDVTLTAEIDEILEADLNCCSGPNVTHPMCLPIEIHGTDPFFSNFGRKCMNFVRSNSGMRQECRLGPREQFNRVTAVLDAGTVYSNVPSTIEKLRTFQGGIMKTLPVFREFGLKDILPLAIADPDKGCIRPNENVFCFFTGDPRVNEQTTLLMIHTMLIRNHNKIASELSYLNPHWSDETLFQEARHINVALVQHITFNEFLPLVLGKSGIAEHGLTLYSEGYFDQYNDKLNPGAASSFTTAAFRFGHSLLPSTVERWSKTHTFIGTQKLSEVLLQPYDLFKAGFADQYLLGMVNQVGQAMDEAVTSQVTNHLFEMPGQNFGLDLVSLNLQRGREHGIPSYARYREWCELSPIVTWSDLYGLMPNHTVQAYSAIYESPEDIDLWSGGVVEFPMEGRLIGQTFSCIIGRQFHNMRHGDRFWYENGGWPSSFSLEQLSEIRKFSVARLVCDNGDDIETMQLRAMLLADHKLNPRYPCRTGEIPRLNLLPWQDFSK